MAFRPPRRCSLVEHLGCGEFFDVAKVHFDRAPAIVKRLRAGFERVEWSGPTPLDRERIVLTLWSHHSAPQVLDSGTDDHGAFVVETWIDGVALTDLLAHPTMPPFALRIRVVSALVRIVDELHTHPGVLTHGDIAPGNVLFSSDSVHLIDFSASGTKDFEATGRGTLPYVAPELCRAETPPTQQTDRYALAVLVARVLCQEPLCSSQSEPANLVEIGDRGHRTRAIQMADSLPHDVRIALQEHLAFLPSARPNSLASLRRALDAWAQLDSARAPS